MTFMSGSAGTDAPAEPDMPEPDVNEIDVDDVIVLPWWQHPLNILTIVITAALLAGMVGWMIGDSNSELAHNEVDTGFLQDMREQDRPPLLVPATSIYSRTDGVAPWQTCIDEVREHTENIEVRGSHIGMGFIPAVVLAVLDRLGQPEGDWRPFAPPQGLRSWYPKPAGWHERRPRRAA